MYQSNVSALSPQSPFKKREFKPAYIKYGGAFLAFLMMIGAIRVFLNYATIQSSIEHVIEEREMIMQHEQYSALQAYVYSLPISKTFIAHDNGILLPWEKIMRKMEKGEVAILQGLSGNGQSGSKSTSDSWSQSIQESSWWSMEQMFYGLPAWKSWVVYFGKKMGAE